MEEIGIGLVNAQAAEIKQIDYPDWVGRPAWTVGRKVGTDEHGYDEYEIHNSDQILVVPANRLVFMKGFIERYKRGTNE